jgi:hypothetical protein
LLNEAAPISVYPDEIVLLEKQQVVLNVAHYFLQFEKFFTLEIGVALFFDFSQ